MKDGPILEQLRYWEANQGSPFITDARKEIERLSAEGRDLRAEIHELKRGLCPHNHEMADWCFCGYVRPTDI